MLRFLPHLLIASAIGLTLAGGILHGRLSQRWGPNDQAAAAGRRLAEFPDQFGDWTTRERSELSKKTADMLQCTGYLNRSFIHQTTGEIVNVAVIVGPPGPISVHTPEICYTSSHYRVLQGRRAVKTRDRTGEQIETWALTLESTRVDKSLLRVHYAWAQEGRWAAIANPRFTTAGQPFLYKLQLAALLPSGSDADDNDPCSNFLADFAPAFKRHTLQP